jgi:aryl-alcohol dehydrogenase-like predicted oxidoreductase
MLKERTGDPRMIYRTLGSAGEKVSPIGIGGWHIGLKNVAALNASSRRGAWKPAVG